jgi:Nickel responsive protein SCO4226-like
MPQFVIERDIPNAHKLSDAEMREVARKSVQALTELGPQIQWVQSYVTENKVYCVYLAPDEATIREHARRAGVPANRVAAVRRLLSVYDAGPPS